jgi:hypothetical protein
MGLSILLATSPILKNRFQHINFNIVSGITNIEHQGMKKQKNNNNILFLNKLKIKTTK